MNNDHLIQKHLKHLSQPPHNGSIKHFLETGQISGGFYAALQALIHDAELNGVTEYKVYQSNKEDDHGPVIKHFQDESGNDNAWDSPTIKHFQD